MYANVTPIDIDIDNDDDDDDATTDKDVQIVRHSSDFFLLGSFCLLTMINQALWITFASVKDDVEQYFSLSDPLLVDLLSNVYMFIFLVLFLPATFFLNHFGLKRGVLVSASINAIGGVLRYFFATGISFGGCVFAQSLCGVSQVLNFCCVGALASSVVKPEFKSRAIGLIWFSTYFGCALGLWIPPMAIGDASSDLLPCLLGFGVAAFLVLLLVATSVYASSGRLTTEAQLSTTGGGSGDTKEFGIAVIALFKNKQYMMVTAGFGCAMGSAYAVATDINSLFAEALAKDSDIGLLGLFFSISAALGVLLVGMLLTAKPEWRGTTHVSLGMSTAAAVALLGNVIGVSSQSVGFIFLCTLLFGFSVTSLNASCLELGQFLSGASEFIVNGSMMASVQLFGIVLTGITGIISAPDDQRKGDTSATVGALIFLFFAQCVATALIWGSTKVQGREGQEQGDGESGARRRRTSSTNKLVSLIDHEEKSGATVMGKDWIVDVDGEEEKETFEI